VQYRRRMTDGAWNKKNDKNWVLVLISHVLCMQLILFIFTVPQACRLRVLTVVSVGRKDTHRLSRLKSKRLPWYLSEILSKQLTILANTITQFTQKFGHIGWSLTG
jgi:hypothetical protein